MHMLCTYADIETWSCKMYAATVKLACVAGADIFRVVLVIRLNKTQELCYVCQPSARSISGADSEVLGLHDRSELGVTPLKSAKKKKHA